MNWTHASYYYAFCYLFSQQQESEAKWQEKVLAHLDLWTGHI